MCIYMMAKEKTIITTNTTTTTTGMWQDISHLRGKQNSNSNQRHCFSLDMKMQKGPNETSNNNYTDTYTGR